MRFPGGADRAGAAATRAEGAGSLAARVGRLVGVAVEGITSRGNGHGWSTYRMVLADGRVVFAKSAAQAMPELFTSEAVGLAWLRAAEAVPVPEVLAADDRTLVLPWLDEERPTGAAAERFGRDLARLHAAGAPSFGASWPGFIAELPQDNTASADWPAWYAERRLLPYLRIAVDHGSLDAADARLVERVAADAARWAGPAEPPSRIHGDCWSGNLLWSGGRGWLVDPAAHGGHRETDLAMLALFGAPALDRILAAYQEVAPLAPGWRERVPLHQLHPLLVHAALFGRGYRDRALAAARALARTGWM